MSLIKPIPSKAIRDACSEGLKELSGLGRVPTDLGPTYLPQQIYHLDIHAAANGTGLEAAKPVVWQFLLGSPSGPAVAADVAHRRRGTKPKMTSLARGPLIAKSIQSTLDVERMPEVQRHNYELRRLWISGVNIRAFWLKSLDGRADLAVPYHKAARELVDMRVYPMDEFLSIVQPLAQRRLKFDDSPRV